MKLSVLTVFSISMLISAFASATIWYAGSNHSGKVVTPISDGKSLIWQCDGQVCQSQENKDQTSAKVACNALVRKIGKVTYLTDKKTIRWSPMKEQKKLMACNKNKLN